MDSAFWLIGGFGLGILALYVGLAWALAATADWLERRVRR